MHKMVLFEAFTLSKCLIHFIYMTYFFVKKGLNKQISEFSSQMRYRIAICSIKKIGGVEVEW